jgi:hypothetical protein
MVALISDRKDRATRGRGKAEVWIEDTNGKKIDESGFTRT